MAYETRQVAGYECNLILSKDRKIVREAVVLVGPADQPGWRAKDEKAAKWAFPPPPKGWSRRRDAKRAVMTALGLPARSVRVVARYSELVPLGDGVIGRRGPDGKITATHKA